MPPLKPPITNNPLALLREAIYGFERDDHDGLVLAKECVLLAVQALSPKRYTHHEPSHQVEDTLTNSLFMCESRDDAENLCASLNELEELRASA